MIAAFHRSMGQRRSGPSVPHRPPGSNRLGKDQLDVRT
jgi:hypothetical protein